MRKISHQRRFVGAPLASLLVALVIFLSLVSASPALHQLIHPDAASSDHHCAVTLFANGLVDSADVALPIIGLVVLFGGIALLPESLVLPVADYRFSASRAPPASILG